jgi:hypothetical protein
MRVRFVGSGDAFGSGGRRQTGIHLSGEIGARRVVLTHMSGAMLARCAGHRIPPRPDGQGILREAW